MPLFSRTPAEPAGRPPLDLIQPAETATATFALG